MRIAPSLMLAAAVTLGCAEGPVIVEDRAAEAIAFGTVTTAAGEPVLAATIQADMIRGPCGGVIAHQWTTQTTAGGAYRILMFLLSSTTTFEACVVVTVEPPAGAGLRPDTLQVDDVSFTLPATDSVRVDFVLASGPPHEGLARTGAR